MASLWELSSSSCLDSDICEMGKISYSFLSRQNDETTQYACPSMLITKRGSLYSPLPLSCLSTVFHLANIY